MKNTMTPLTQLTLGPFRKWLQRETSLLDRQRLALLLFCYIPFLLLGVVANFLGVTEPSAPFFYYTHTLLVFSAAVFLVLYYRRKISITICFAAFIIIGQTILSVEMIYCAFQRTLYYDMLIMANMVLLSLNALVATAGMMKQVSVLLGITTLFIYILCAWITGDEILNSFIIVFILVFLFSSVIGVWVANSMDQLEHENEEYKKGEKELLHILRLKRDEVKAFVALASEKYSCNGTQMLLEQLDTKSKHNLVTNVEAYLKTRNTDLEIIAQKFPELTPSEREICRLILQGKKLYDICRMLGKNESNVNSQRANMRKKLGLQPAENLQKALQQRLEETV